MYRRDLKKLAFPVSAFSIRRCQFSRQSLDRKSTLTDLRKRIIKSAYVSESIKAILLHLSMLGMIEQQPYCGFSRVNILDHR